MSIQKKISVIVQKGQVIPHAPMDKYTTFRTGGPADLLVIPGSLEELQGCVSLLAAEGESFMVMGNGSNILVRDGGYRGIIIRMDKCCQEITGEGPLFTVGSAASLAAVAHYVQRKGYTGFEFASGIPGTVGGAAFMNAGAYGGEMKEVIETVTLLHRDSSGIYRLTCKKIKYGYRHNVLYESGNIIIYIEFVRLHAKGLHLGLNSCNILIEALKIHGHPLEGVDARHLPVR